MTASKAPCMLSVQAGGDMIWDPIGYREKTGFVPELGKPLLEYLPKTPARILDIGCGEGALTQEIVDNGYEVVGIDADPGMVAATVARGLNAMIGDAQTMTLTDFDACLSNAALHWMPDTRAVVRNVRNALHPGGIFVGECGGSGNINGIRAALRDALLLRNMSEEEICPWTFPDPESFRDLLESEGFIVDELQHFPVSVFVPDIVEDWLRLFGGVYLNLFPEEEDQSAFLVDFRAAAHTHLTNHNDSTTQTGPRSALSSSPAGWELDYVRLRWVAHLAPL